MDQPSLPRRITPHNGPWSLLDSAASRTHERQAIAGSGAGTLMDTAGLAVARLVLARWPAAQRVTVWAGPGNNGGDGLVAARCLHSAGLCVTVNLVADATRLPEDAAQALRSAQNVGLEVVHWAGQPVAAADLQVDALLGLGSKRAPAGWIAQAIAAIAEAYTPVLALDLPTGLNADTGTLYGASAVHATATLSLLNLKPGCFTALGRDFAGEMWLCELGQRAPDGSTTLIGAPMTEVRPHAAHKGRFGDVAIIGGAPGMTGAAWLAGGAALAAGAGRVYLSLLDPHTQCSPRPELMLRDSWWQQSPTTLAAATVVAGCGGGPGIANVLPALLSHAGRLVLDADALNAIAADAALLQQLRHRRGQTLLTPHPLEAARLLGSTAAVVQSDRLTAARLLVALTGATVLLKGSGTIVASPALPCAVNPTGNAALATAGSGDVLAGWCAGGWAAEPEAAAAAIAARSAWQHGDAADRFALKHPHRPLRAAELIEWLANGG